MSALGTIFGKINKGKLVLLDEEFFFTICLEIEKSGAG
jgi:hypothetical protein